MLAAQLAPQFKCHTCKPIQKEQRGCTAPPKLPMVMDDEVLKRCPMRGFYEDPAGYNELFQRYRWLKEGFLCDPGLLPDQSARFVYFVEVITAATDVANAQIQKKRETEANLKSKVAAAGTRNPRPQTTRSAKPRPWRSPRR